MNLSTPLGIGVVASGEVTEMAGRATQEKVQGRHSRMQGNLQRHMELPACHLIKEPDTFHRVGLRHRSTMSLGREHCHIWEDPQEAICLHIGHHRQAMATHIMPILVFHHRDLSRRQWQVLPNGVVMLRLVGRHLLNGVVRVQCGADAGRA